METDNTTLILQEFCRHIDEETFEDGLNWVQSELKTCFNNRLPFQIDPEVSPVLKNTQAIAKCEQGALLYYCGCYFIARILVENTYHYFRAQDFIKCSIEIINLLPTSCICKTLRVFADIQNSVCDVDRAIYTSQAQLMLEAVDKINSNLAEVEGVACAELGIPYFQQAFQSYALYAQSCKSFS